MKFSHQTEVSINGDTLKWMFFFMKNPKIKWMIFRGPHDLGNLLFSQLTKL
jgi:hypothetical protein